MDDGPNSKARTCEVRTENESLERIGNGPKASTRELHKENKEKGNDPESSSEEYIEDEIEDFQEVSASKRSKKLLIVGICVSCVCGAIIIGFLCSLLVDDSSATLTKQPYISSYRHKPSGYKVCRTQKCKAASKYIRNHMNLSANPCRGVFNYVCGGWLKNIKNKKPPSVNRWTAINDFESKIENNLIKVLDSKEPSTSRAANEAKRLFKKCMKGNMTREKQGIRRVAYSLGGFPLFPRSPYDKTVAWYMRQAKAVRQYSMREYNSAGFTLGAILNMDFDPERNIKIVKPPRTLYDMPFHYKSASYKHFVHDQLCLFLENSCTQAESKKIYKQLHNLTEFQWQLSEFIQADDNDNPENITVGEFENLYPELHVHDFLQEVFLYSPVLIDDQTTLIVSSHKFLRNLAKLVRETDAGVLDNNIGLLILLNLVFNPEAPHILLAYRKTNLHEGGTKDHVRALWCMRKVRYPYNFAVSRLFVDKYFDSNVKDTLLQVFKNMKKAYINMIKEKKWLLEEPKKMAIKKIQELLVYIGYADWIKNDLQLDMVYSAHLKHNKDDDTMIEGVSKLFALTTAFEFKFLRGKIPKSPFYDVTPIYYNGVYNSAFNRVIFPLALYFGDAYWPKTIKALKYSGAAFTMAHEMVHSLGKYGVKKDYKGDRSNWLAGKSLQNFESRVNCLLRQYANVIDEFTGIPLLSNKTVSEDISDNGAIRIIYKAYMLSGPKDERLPGLESINDKQLLFVGAMMNMCAYFNKISMLNAIGKSHSPYIYRVLLPVSNCDDFAKVFKCPKGSAMNKKEKCVVW